MPRTVASLKDAIRDIPDETIVFVKTKDNIWTSRVDTSFLKVSENEYHLYITGFDK